MNKIVNNYLLGIRHSVFKYKVPTMAVVGLFISIACVDSAPDFVRGTFAILGFIGLLILGLFVK